VFRSAEPWALEVALEFREQVQRNLYLSFGKEFSYLKTEVSVIYLDGCYDRLADWDTIIETVIDSCMIPLVFHFEFIFT
jgi:hypothetical protein